MGTYKFYEATIRFYRFDDHIGMKPVVTHTIHIAANDVGSAQVYATDYAFALCRKYGWDDYELVEIERIHERAVNWGILHCDL